MSRRAAILLAAFLLCSPSLRSAEYTISIPKLERAIHDAVNAERKRHGLKVLESDDKLAAIARKHSRDMAKRDYLSHRNPEGRGPTERGKAAGFPIRKPTARGYAEGLAENLFKGHLYHSVLRIAGIKRYKWISQADLARSIVSGWMNSPGHRKNILTGSFDMQGIGAAVSKERLEVYVTQMFW